MLTQQIEKPGVNMTFQRTTVPLATRIRHKASQLSDHFNRCAHAVKVVARSICTQLHDAYEGKPDYLTLRTQNVIDQLTGLPKGQACIDTVASHIGGVRRGVYPQAVVVFIDLNGLKAANDSGGHAAGDNLIKRFAHDLRAHLRANDFFGRKHGDEFIVVGETTNTEVFMSHVRRSEGNFCAGYEAFDRNYLTAHFPNCDHNKIDNKVLAEYVIARADLEMIAQKRALQNTGGIEGSRPVSEKAMHELAASVNELKVRINALYPKNTSAPTLVA